MIGPASRWARWRRRLAYRLLAVPFERDGAALADDTNLTAVRLDFPSTDIWLRVTSAPERRWRARSCAKEPWTVQWIQREIRKDEVLYDVGANVGAFSLIAAMDRGAKVVAFEPGYTTFARLCENIQLNACGDRIVPVPLPVGNSPGLQAFHYRSVEPGQSRHTLEVDVPGAAESQLGAVYVQPVCVTTLDQVVSDFGLALPHHLKIDVDGSELRVLEGAQAVLRGPQLRTVLIETDAGDWDGPASLLTGAGFRLDARHGRPGKPNAPTYAVWVH